MKEETMAGYTDIVDEFRGVVATALDGIESGKEARRSAKVLADAAALLVEYGQDKAAKPITTWADEFAAMGGAETDETKKLRNRVKGLIDAEIMDDGETAEAAQLVEWYGAAYKSTATGTGTRQSGVTTPDFEFAIKAICPDHGEVVVEGQRTGHAYWNSLRHSCRKHEKSAHSEADLTGKDSWKAAKDSIATADGPVTAGRFTLEVVK